MKKYATEEGVLLRINKLMTVTALRKGKVVIQ